MKLPFEEALRIGSVMDGIPCDVDNEKPSESEPKLAEEGDGVEVSEGMRTEGEEAIEKKRKEEEEDCKIK